MFKFEVPNKLIDFEKINNDNLIFEGVKEKDGVHLLTYTDGEKTYFKLNLSDDSFSIMSGMYNKSRYFLELNEINFNIFKDILKKSYIENTVKDFSSLESFIMDINNNFIGAYTFWKNEHFYILKEEKDFYIVYDISKENVYRNLYGINGVKKVEKHVVDFKHLNLILDLANQFTFNLIDMNFKKDFDSFKDHYKELIRKVIKIIKFKKDHGNDLYETFYIPKTDGTKREINAPIEETKQHLKHKADELGAILEYRINKYDLDENIIAYRKNRSIKNNAEYHKENKVIIKFDISKFFDNCEIDYWKNVYLYRIKDENMKKRILELFENFYFRSDNKGLYMGNPMSPAISNLIILPCVRYIKNVLNKMDSNIKFSIYADDITFSSDEINDEFNPKRLRNLVEYTFKFYNYKFRLKEEKTLVMKDNKRKITGLSVNHKNEVTISQKKYRHLRMILHLLSKGVGINDIKGFDDALQLYSTINFYLDVDTSGKVERLIKYKYRNQYEYLKEQAVRK